MVGGGVAIPFVGHLSCVFQQGQVRKVIVFRSVVLSLSGFVFRVLQRFPLFGRLCLWVFVYRDCRFFHERVGRLYLLTISPFLLVFLIACSFNLVGTHPCVFQTFWSCCVSCVSCSCLFELASAVRSNHADVVTS